MEHLIKGMRKTMAELNAWQDANPDVPEVVVQAIDHYYMEMCRAIEEAQKPPFEIGDEVELISSSYEDGGHFSGDTGMVIDVKSAELPEGTWSHDIRVDWDNGAEECWMGAEDFCKR
ncbi:hypothetical protein P7H06_22300 [Paenibacillus larvae]|nr:hypothetical protein [Paenibacillus larvae]MDT2261683.1 hypothetical protein [Paenibacillus larvae]